MQSKLDQNQIERISEWYHSHPLLTACKQAFKCYEADMQELLFAPEEIFLEATIILDFLLEQPNNGDYYVGELWYNLKTKIRRWDPKVPQTDLDNICGAILYVVAAVLCQHPQEFFCNNVKDKILTLVRNNMPIDAAEEERIIKELSMCAGGLSEWLGEYKECDTLLSEEIIDNLSRTDMDIKEKVLGVSPASEIEQQLLSIFYGNEENVRAFLESIKDAKPTQITMLVKKWVNENKISELSCHRDLWKVLHNNGLYTPSETNWNKQLR